MNTKVLIIPVSVILIAIILVLTLSPENEERKYGLGDKEEGEGCQHHLDCKEYPKIGCNPGTKICSKTYALTGTACESDESCIGYPVYKCSGACIRAEGTDAGEPCTEAEECIGYPGAGCIEGKCQSGPNTGCPAGEVPCGYYEGKIYCCLGV